MSQLLVLDLGPYQANHILRGASYSGRGREIHNTSDIW